MVCPFRLAEPRLACNCSASLSLRSPARDIECAGICTRASVTRHARLPLTNLLSSSSEKNHFFFFFKHAWFYSFRRHFNTKYSVGMMNVGKRPICISSVSECTVLNKNFSSYPLSLCWRLASWSSHCVVVLNEQMPLRTMRYLYWWNLKFLYFLLNLQGCTAQMD